MCKATNNFIGRVNNPNHGWRSLLAGVVSLFLLVSAFSLLADQPAVGTPVTNELSGNLNLALSATTNIASVDATNSLQALDDNYRLAIGDRLSFEIKEDNGDSKPLQVTDSGDIEFPYIGRFPVVGKTCKQLAGELKSQFEKEYYFHATVIVAVDFKARSQGKIYLVGPVRSAGPQEIPSDEEFTLSKAILRAGGFTDFADQHHVRVTRKETDQGVSSNKTYVVDVDKILSKGHTELDLVLEPGDLIFIPEKMIRF